MGEFSGTVNTRGKPKLRKNIQVTRCLLIRTGNPKNETHFKAIAGETKYAIDRGDIHLKNGNWCNSKFKNRWFSSSNAVLKLNLHSGSDRRFLTFLTKAGIQPVDKATKLRAQKLLRSAADGSPSAPRTSTSADGDETRSLLDN